jgi:hypothetical protein
MDGAEADLDGDGGGGNGERVGYTGGGSTSERGIWKRPSIAPHK